MTVSISRCCSGCAVINGMQKHLSLRDKSVEQGDSEARHILAASHDSLLPFFCCMLGGRAVIDGMQKHLALSDKSIEPSRAGLYRWGNVSSASVW
jgi:hypothetical protein